MFSADVLDNISASLGHISGRPGVPPKGHLAGVELSERVKNEVADRGGEEIKKLSPALSAVTTSPSLAISLSLS